MRGISRAGRWAAVAAAVVAATVAGGSAGIAEAQPGGAAVRIVDFAFEPASVTVPVGGRVTWTHAGMAPHTVTASGGAFNSDRLTAGQTFSFTFPTAGSFAYNCEIHPRMMGTVVVQAAGALPPAPQPTTARPSVPVQPTAAPARPPAQAPARPAAPPAQAAARPPAAAPRPAPARPAVPVAQAPVRPVGPALPAVPRTGVGPLPERSTVPVWPAALAMLGVLSVGTAGVRLATRRARISR